MIKKIVIQNYKIFSNFDLEFNDGLNIIVGDNEAGKSTILEAVNLALTKRLSGKFIENELSPYIFNAKCVVEYLSALKEKKETPPPSILIELYLVDNPQLEALRGTMNSKREDSIGVKLEIAFDTEFSEEYEALISNSTEMRFIPIEYYKVSWYSFANNAITTRSLPSLSYIDATTIRLQSGTDYYLHDIIKNGLDTKERVSLSIAYRNLKEAFSREESISRINSKLRDKRGAITDKNLSISIDVSQRASWETNLIPHIDAIPFQMIGKGEQSALKVMLALDRNSDADNLILIEEPENHLSFSSMNKLILKISERCKGKQILITTHSAYVLNKLGLENLILLCERGTTTLRKLSESTQRYFKKLPGYDTLRLVLAKQTILVEGPSDELIIQKAYLQQHKVLPIEHGIDVISLRGLSFARFFDIAVELKKNIVAVTDNDGNYKKNIEKKYAAYMKHANIKICSSTNNDAKTLEPQIVAVNTLEKLNQILETSFENKEELAEYMENNKTESAMKIFESSEEIVYPEYITYAITQK